MAQQFRVPNFPDINLQDQTQLTADADSGQADIAVVGVKGMSANDLGIIGQPGSIIGEIQKIKTITSLAITFNSDLINKHRQGEAFTILFGDQIKAYRVLATNNYPPDDTVFAANPLGSPFDIDFDSPTTLFNDNTGSNQYWYKFVFYNSVTAAETNLAASAPIRGGINDYCSSEDIRREAGLLDFGQIADTQVAARKIQGRNEIDSALLAAGYVLPLKDGQGNPYVPPMIANANRLLSAGYVLIQDYGPIAEGNSKDGADKLKAAKQILSDLQERKKILVDIAGQMMAMSARVRGTPDDTTAFYGNDTQGTPEPPLFTMSQKF